MEIENYIIANLKEINESELLEEIKKSTNDEALPGLGVLFKLYFNSLDENKKSQVVKRIISIL